MTPDTTSATLAAAAQVVSGPDNPNDVRATNRPTPVLTWAMAVAGVPLAAMVTLVIYALGYGRWPEVDAGGRVHALAAIALALTVVLIVVVLRLASGEFRTADVKIGSSTVKVEAEPEPGA